jgi:hypothetical protein
MNPRASPNMESKRKLLPILALSVFLIASTPAVYASTLKVSLNPSSQTATVTSSSNTVLILTYPSNSSISHYLRNYSSSVTWKGSFSGNSEGALVLQGGLEEEDHDVRIKSMNVSYSLKATGNATAFVLNKETDITAVVTGVFKVVNGTVTANLDWKAYHVPGDMTLKLEDHTVEVNHVGSTFETQLGSQPYLAGAFSAMFGGGGLWHKSTLDFSALNSPLSTWTRNYDSVSNTTTYSKTVNGQESLNASANFNGQRYALSVKSDPSADVSTPGYAIASGNALVIQPTPLLLTPTIWVAAAVAVLAAIGAAFYMVRRTRIRGQPSIQSVSNIK